MAIETGKRHHRPVKSFRQNLFTKRKAYCNLQKRVPWGLFYPYKQDIKKWDFLIAQRGHSR